MADKPVTNLDKFYKIQTMMDEFNSLRKPYLDTLKQRNEYMSEYRQEFRKLVRTLQEVKSSLKKTNSYDEEIKVLVKSAKIQLKRQLEAFEELKESDPYSDYQQAIDAVNESLDALNHKMRSGKLENVIVTLAKHRVMIRELEAMTELIEANTETNEETTRKILQLIDIAENDYLSGFKAYRKACENDEGAADMFNDIYNVLVQLGYDNEATMLRDALPDYEEERKARPNPDELLEVLRPVKSAGLSYWKSNRAKAESYSKNAAFAEKLAYARRALLEDREYNGTLSAFDDLQSKYDELSDYMYERYHELGGEPHNYHGHNNRVKK